MNYAVRMIDCLVIFETAKLGYYLLFTKKKQIVVGGCFVVLHNEH
jgi:hypothetical protein